MVYNITNPCLPGCANPEHDLYVLEQDNSPVLVGLPHDVQIDREGFTKITLGRITATHALSIQQPWVDRILYEGKDIENRTWPLPSWVVGRRIALHASKKPQSGIRYPADRLGALLGEATITGCVTNSNSKWFEGPYGFILENTVAYPEPIRMSGRLGFWHIPSLRKVT